MDMQINSISSYSGVQDPSTLALRDQYLGALSAALRSGDAVSAQQALLGFVGTGGIVSPSTLYERLKQALQSGDKTQMDQLARDVMNAQDAQQAPQVVNSVPPSTPTSTSSSDPKHSVTAAVDRIDHALLVAQGLGSIINTSA
jgi:3-oxoacyl-(acyl-carrier-protein) synthase